MLNTSDKYVSVLISFKVISTKINKIVLFKVLGLIKLNVKSKTCSKANSKAIQEVGDFIIFIYKHLDKLRCELAYNFLLLKELMLFSPINFSSLNIAKVSCSSLSLNKLNFFLSFFLF